MAADIFGGEFLSELPTDFQNGAVAPTHYESQSEKDAWLESRRGRITASTIGKLFTDKYAVANNETVKKYVDEKKAEQLGFKRRKSFTTKEMQHGIDNEPIALHLFETVLGEAVVPNREFILHSIYTDYGATPDAFVPVKKAVVEVKCPYNAGIHVAHMRMKTWEAVKANLKEYYCQIQSGIHATDSEMGYFVSYCPHEDVKLALHIVEIPRDAALIEKMALLIENTIALIRSDI